MKKHCKRIVSIFAGVLLLGAATGYGWMNYQETQEANARVQDLEDKMKKKEKEELERRGAEAEAEAQREADQRVKESEEREAAIAEEEQEEESLGNETGHVPPESGMEIQEVEIPENDTTTEESESSKASLDGGTPEAIKAYQDFHRTIFSYLITDLDGLTDRFFINNDGVYTLEYESYVRWKRGIEKTLSQGRDLANSGLPAYFEETHAFVTSMYDVVGACLEESYEVLFASYDDSGEPWLRHLDVLAPAYTAIEEAKAEVESLQP